MKIEFTSYFDGKMTKNCYDMTIFEGIWSFFDENNIKIEVKNEDDVIVLRRSGSVEQIFNFKVNQKTTSCFKNEDGLELDFQVLTKAMKMTNTYFFISYVLYVDENPISCHKITGKIVEEPCKM